ncbi:sulfate/molybdate ABC transporter ATP-binding protein [Kurthia gibsonii]|uniref:Sulfate/molybdate ABC transporter ATP-binding protein n=1 Tax=Kurthia gibsonii TaxID=33946 RepID=A0ABU9LGF3_9BACL|nr:sulfate/molybdate ABC transporter ATP-binding protein [Kurthia gibsonii]MEB7771574.1 sulfate/molybdate ABC transporter ATP-binding protein [Kurthia gibsonii]RXH53553.1 sulfate/molybdate ABC transporter ATP-binding protein [Kurthia gibsonii]HZG11819.1 sulfate/molybdate ABC transporter ATP-binding protein [Kurthia gibsonii]
MSIELREIDKHFGQYHALQKISLSIQPGELVALLGPSGSGKTSLLRIIAGLETLDEGTILFDQKEVVHLSAKERNIGFVFQHYALFNHMTVFDNVAYGLKVRPKKLRPSKKEIEDKVIELLALVKLEHFAKRYPSQLSGGQRQRVALARALAVEPKVLLLDEPFGALDAKVRKDLRRWLRKLHNDYHITSIFVTHDQEEALDVADRIVIMNEGRIEQIGSPVEVYENPASPFVYDFLGNVNLFKGRLRKGELINGDFSFKVPGSNLDSEQETVGYVRPHDVAIEKEVRPNTVKATVLHIHPIGATIHIELHRPDTNDYLEAEITKEFFNQLAIEKGDTVYIHPKQLKVFVPEDFSI